MATRKTVEEQLDRLLKCGVTFDSSYEHRVEVAEAQANGESRGDFLKRKFKQETRRRRNARKANRNL